MLKTVDARNIPCPGPVIEAKKAWNEMKEGTLEVWVDNAMAVQNLLKLASYLKAEAGSEKLAEDSYKVVFQSGEKSMTERNSSNGGEAEECLPDSRKTGTLVVLSADHMGEGDDGLGRALMKGFIYALTELDRLPETILLYNGGAKLSVDGSDSLDDLKLLESQGVEVLTCGTCLNHYGLTDKLAVGTVTNMYVISEKMMAAKSIIKP